MKKRFLCAALTVALVAAEILPAAAAETQPAAEAEQIVVSDGEVVAEGDEADQGVEVQDAQQIVGEEEAPEEQIAEEPAEEEDLQETAETVSENDAEAEESEDEIDAQGQAAYAAPVDFKENYPLGKDTVLTFNVDKGKSFSYTIKQGTTVISSNPATALPSNTGSSFDQISITLPLSNKGSYPVGTYTLIVFETGQTEESFNRSFKIARSIGTENTELVTRPTIVESSIVYTGNDITPQVTIVDKVGGKNVTLKQGTDFKVTVTSANKKNIGKATATVEGMGSYAGKVDLEYVIKPQAPNLPTAVCISDSAIKLGWNKVAIAQTYQVWRKKASEKN
ncbi:MAG: hypothetical protein K6E84_05810, partial [Lachnospiraceae bacterium]|nr:hypothetical protein [Lachnospiraceae bacterium]